jgi:hypothetical protein
MTSERNQSGSVGASFNSLFIRVMYSYTCRPKGRLFGRRPAGRYLIDFVRSHHTNPARIPIGINADWYYVLPPNSVALCDGANGISRPLKTKAYYREH